jgi:hypothetical protein
MTVPYDDRYRKKNRVCEDCALGNVEAKWNSEVKGTPQTWLTHPKSFVFVVNDNNGDGRSLAENKY